MNPATPPVDPTSTTPEARERHDSERNDSERNDSKLLEAAPAEGRLAELDAAQPTAHEPEIDPPGEPETSAAAEPEIDAPLQPEVSLSAEPEADELPKTETLPVPSGPRRIQSAEPRPGKINFWKRIAMRRAERARTAAQTLELFAKMSTLDERLESTQATILGRLDRIEEQIDSVWVVEEQLSQLSEIQEKLDALRSEQRGIIEAVAQSSTPATGSAWGSKLALVALLAAAAAGAVALVRMGL
jgi:hypothetical protein